MEKGATRCKECIGALKNRSHYTPSTLFTPSNAARPAERKFLGPPVLKTFLEKATHAQTTLTYLCADSKPTHTTTTVRILLAVWHASHSHASHVSRRYTRIPLARISHPTRTLLTPLVSIPLARIPLVHIPLTRIPLARIALARKFPGLHAKGCTQRKPLCLPRSSRHEEDW